MVMKFDICSSPPYYFVALMYRLLRCITPCKLDFTPLFSSLQPSHAESCCILFCSFAVYFGYVLPSHSAAVCPADERRCSYISPWSTAIYYKRSAIMNRIPESIRDRLPGSRRDYTLLPTSFEDQAAHGYSSSAFDLAGNVAGDSRVGLDEVCTAHRLQERSNC